MSNKRQAGAGVMIAKCVSAHLANHGYFLMSQERSLNHTGGSLLPQSPLFSKVPESGGVLAS